MNINQEQIEGSLNDVNNRLHATMTEREKIYDKADFDLSRMITNLHLSGKVDESTSYIIGEIRSYLDHAKEADSSVIGFLRTELAKTVNNIKTSVPEPMASSLLKMAVCVSSAINHPKAAKPRDIFRNAKAAVREDLLGSIFGDRIGGAIGEAIDRRKRNIQYKKDYKIGVLSDRRGRLANVLDNVKLEKPNQIENKNEKKVNPRIIGNATPNVSAAIAEPVPAPPPLVLAENQRISKTGKNIMTKHIGEDGKVTWKRSKNPDYRKVAETDKNKVEAAVRRENDEELLEFIKEQNQLLEKIELNTRGLSNFKNIEKKDTNQVGLISTPLKNLTDIVTKIPGIVGSSIDKFASLAQTLLGGRNFDKLTTGGKVARVAGNFAAGLTLANAAGNTIKSAIDTESIAKQAQKDPNNVSMMDRALSGFGGFVASMNPLTLAASATGHISQREINEHIGSGVHSYARDIGNIYGDARKAGMNPLFAGTAGLLGATMSEGNTFDKMVDTIGRPVANAVNSTKTVIPTAVEKAKDAVETVYQIPKNVLSGILKPKANPITFTEKAATMIPSKARPVIEKAMINMNPATPIREAINRMSDTKLSSDQIKMKLSSWAKDMEEKHGIPADVLIAQILHESGNLRSSLATQHFNWSGIKAYGDRLKDGNNVTMRTWEDMKPEQLQNELKRRPWMDSPFKQNDGNMSKGLVDVTDLDNKEISKINPNAMFGSEAARNKLKSEGKRRYILNDKFSSYKTMDESLKDYEEKAKNILLDKSGKLKDPKDWKWGTAVNYGSTILKDAKNNPNVQNVLAMTPAKTGVKLAQGSSSVNRPAPPPIAPVMIDNRKTNITGGSGGGSPQSGIPNVRNEESSFRRSNEKSSR